MASSMASFPLSKLLSFKETLSLVGLPVNSHSIKSVQIPQNTATTSVITPRISENDLQKMEQILTKNKQEHEHTIPNKTDQSNCSDPCDCCGEFDRVFDDSRGEWICNNCGVVIEQGCIDGGKDWRSYSAEDENKRSHCGAPTNMFLYDGGLSTKISKDMRDYKGTRVSAISAATIRKITVLNDHTKTDHRMHNNYSEAMAELGKLAAPNIFDLSSSIQERVAYMYKKILKSRELKGFNIRYILIALIYRACQEGDDLRTIFEITTKGKIKAREFLKYNQKILNFFNIKAIRPQPKMYLRRIYTKLQIKNERVYLAARQICEMLEFHANRNFKLIVGKDPASVAGGALYLACKLAHTSRTQHDIGKIINVSEVTIRARYKEICPLLNIPLHRIT